MRLKRKLVDGVDRRGLRCNNCAGLSISQCFLVCLSFGRDASDGNLVKKATDGC